MTALSPRQEWATSALKKSVVVGIGGALFVYVAGGLKGKLRLREFLSDGALIGGATFGVLFLLGRSDALNQDVATRGAFATKGPADVFHAQFDLGKLGYAVEATGVMDAKTTAALKKFQATYSLQRTDGSVNPETLAYLDSVVKQSANAVDPQTGLHQSVTTLT